VTTAELRPAWIDEPAALAAICERARQAGQVAVDTEADSLHSYFHKLCLVQLSIDGTHALVDPLALGRENLEPLARLLADPAVRKLLHGADYDLRVLDRDLGARVANVRDTQVAAQLLGEPQTGLAALAEKLLGVALDKKFQRADWGERPLSIEARAYAAGDTAFLAALSAAQTARLAELGRLAWWEEECAALEAIRWEPPEPDPLAFERIKGARALRGAARDRLAALFAWREQRAADDDVPPFKILQAEAMVALAAAPPADLDALAAVRGVGRSTVRRFGRELLGLIAAPPAVPDRLPKDRFVVDRERELRFKQLRSVRDEVAAGLAVDGGVLAPRAALEAVVDRLPSDEAALADCLGRSWRAAVLAPFLLPVASAWRGGS
jgi:ribonuclease D